MKELSKLTPAETLIVIEGNNALFKDLLKFTFMDLLLKQVLITERKNYRPSKKDPLQEITYVKIGKNFSTYKPLNHELVFLLGFKKSKTLKILFRHMVKMAFENSKTGKSFQKIIISSPQISDSIKINFFQKIFGGFSLNNVGKDLKNKIIDELAYLEEYLPPLITSDKVKALEVLKVIKGNIFLLKNVDFNLLHKIDKELMEEMNPHRKVDEEPWGCSGCISPWDSFDHDLHSFDSSCSSADSGCGSSGCSGCSGCGGCGGGD